MKITKITKITPEEETWISYEKGWDAGYEAGIRDFEAVRKIIKELREKGIPVVDIMGEK